MSVSTMRANLSPYMEFLSAQIRAHPLATASAVGAVPVISHIISSYSGYLALGRGGLPSNFLGWLMQAILQPFVYHTLTDPAPYRDPKRIKAYAPHGRTSYLGHEPLAQRRGERPTVPGYVAPQRQTTEKGDTTLIARMNASLAEVANSSATLEIRPSGLEGKDSDALFLNVDKASLPQCTKVVNGEVAHVHSEASSHLVLSLADAEVAMQKGWAQRHKLSGGFTGLPMGYVMVYAPRDDEEFAVWERLVRAAVAFSSAASGLEVKVDG